MKKILSFILCAVMTVSSAIPCALAAEEKAKKTAILFIPGIGQTTSLIIDQKLPTQSKAEGTDVIDVSADKISLSDALKEVKKLVPDVKSDAELRKAVKLARGEYSYFDKAELKTETNKHLIKFIAGQADGTVKSFFISGKENYDITKADVFFYANKDGVVKDTWSDKIYDYKGEAFNVKYTGNMVNFNNDLNEVAKLIREPEVTIGLIKLLKTLLTNNFCLSYEEFRDALLVALKDNILDENGAIPENVFVPEYDGPISQYPVALNSSYGIERISRDIPINCLIYNSILDENGNVKTDETGRLVADTKRVTASGDNIDDCLFVYTHPPFGFTTDFSAELRKQILDIISSGFDDVILIPMSQGGTIASQYLYDCKEKGVPSYVSKVISVVGCWNGSDIVTDLIEQNYSEYGRILAYSEIYKLFGYSPALKFFGQLADLLLVRGVVRNQNLVDVLAEAVSVLVDEFILKTPSLLTLIPYEDYDRIKNKLSGAVRAEMDTYHKAQRAFATIRDKDDPKSFAEENFTDIYPDTEFYFISGYGLQLGQGTEKWGNADALGTNLSMCQFLASTAGSNSDEVIPIESTCPGSVSAPAGTSFPDEYIAAAKENGTYKYIDGNESNSVEGARSNSVDISGCPDPDKCWLFFEEVHQLDGNTTALNIALGLALGKFDNVTESGYPQFNESKALGKSDGDLFKEVTGNLKKFLRKYDGDLSSDFYKKGLEYLRQCCEITDGKRNDRSADDEKIHALSQSITQYYEDFITNNPESSASMAADNYAGDAKKQIKAMENNMRIADLSGFDKFCEAVNPVLEKVLSSLFDAFGTKGLRDVSLTANVAISTVLNSFWVEVASVILVNILPPILRIIKLFK